MAKIDSQLFFWKTIMNHFGANEMTTKRTKMSFVIRIIFIHLQNKKIQLLEKQFFPFYIYERVKKLWNVNFTNRMLNRCKIKGSVFTIFCVSFFVVNRNFPQHKPFSCHLTAIFHSKKNKFKWKTSSCKIFLQKTGNKLLFEVFPWKITFF